VAHYSFRWRPNSNKIVHIHAREMRRLGRSLSTMTSISHLSSKTQFQQKMKKLSDPCPPMSVGAERNPLSFSPRWLQRVNYVIGLLILLIISLIRGRWKCGTGKWGNNDIKFEGPKMRYWKMWDWKCGTGKCGTNDFKFEGPKMRYWKMQDVKMQDQKCRGGKCRTGKCMSEND